MTKVVEKTVAVLDTLLNIIVVIVGVLMIGISVYSLMDNHWQYQGAMDESLLSYKPALDEPMEDVPLISDGQVAWLHIDDTNIDYPIMQGEDNFEYLNKDPYGEFKLSGSIFLDFRNDSSFSDSYSIIYGHHMERGVMFGSLDSFRDETYFNTHITGQLVTKDKVYDVTLFAVSDADAIDQRVFNPTGKTTSDIISFLEENATIYSEPAEGENIIAMSTCSGDASTDRLMVFGTLCAK